MKIYKYISVCVCVWSVRISLRVREEERNRFPGEDASHRIPSNERERERQISKECKVVDYNTLISV